MRRLIQRSARAARVLHLESCNGWGSLAHRLNDSRDESLALDLELERSAKGSRFISNQTVG
jgi:hypothetical protein